MEDGSPEEIVLLLFGLLRFVFLSSAAVAVQLELVPLYVEIGACEFPGPGQYTFQVRFQSKKEGEALKGELPLSVLSPEE